MEQALGRAGLPRHPAEAPFEYVERALLSLDTSTDSARRLTALFERAKFSHHEPAPEMRDEAIDALVAVRDELARPGGRVDAGVKAERRRVATLVVLTTLALIVVLGLQPVSTDRILAAYVLALAAIALAAGTRILAAGSWRDRGSHFEHLLARKPGQPSRPSELVRIERELTLGASSAGHLRTRLCCRCSVMPRRLKFNVWASRTLLWNTSSADRLHLLSSKNMAPEISGAICFFDLFRDHLPQEAFFAGAFLAGPFLAGPFSSGKSSMLILALSHVSMKGLCV